ncbi:DUF6361 family protein [Tessaracoccus sp. MC1756]|uniref:DUF6361 family protein n=1 Tax=Tessaracoccus sp. MC1756 TaxID=2760311 RepID=UPI0018204306|nr:DUF6361 family protein [Tessaracoccus sp. MC1756]MBB1510282.1 hypothetical protein [Tessaracoccus sp. MC1756]
MIAWVDTTPEQHRAACELVALFSQPDTRDELGVGQVRDVLSNMMFPGITVLQTRARYYLFVPWCYQVAEERARRKRSTAPDVQTVERELIRTLLKTGDTVGLIGGRVGDSVVNLPSAMFWVGLEKFDIVRTRTGKQSVGLNRFDLEGETEIAERPAHDWHPSLPPPPADFPNTVEGGFALQPAEADWLTERILLAQEHTLLAQLITRPASDYRDARFPWEVRQAMDLPEVDHARRFSIAAECLARLYALLVAREYDRNHRLTKHGDNVHGRVLDSYLAWQERNSQDIESLASWDDAEFWAMVTSRNPRIHWATESLVRELLRAVRAGRTLQEDAALSNAIHRRESLKGPKSRLENPSMLQTWNGHDGGGRISYRWSNVVGILSEIAEARNRDVVA